MKSNRIGRDPVLRDLFAVVTVKEAARRWKKHANTVKWAIAAGKLDCRKSGNVWLITYDSLVKLWGKPTLPDLTTVELVLPMWRKSA